MSNSAPQLFDDLKPLSLEGKIRLMENLLNQKCSDYNLHGTIKTKQGESKVISLPGNNCIELIASATEIIEAL